MKNINAIQNLGAMDVLCTDKTGTLTQDKVILERHMDVMGRDDDRVLRHAYLNSHFQTGLKNLIDVAVIEKMGELASSDPELAGIDGRYTKVDEIPFDFERRLMSVVVEDAQRQDAAHHQGRRRGGARRLHLRRVRRRACSR